MSTAILSLGSNMGDRANYLREAVISFGSCVQAVSSVYRTPPWGPVQQDDYYNLTLQVSDSKLQAADWLDRCHLAEAAAGRERVLRWGPRTLDADVVAVWDSNHGPVISDDPVLTLPHPRAFERGFVLIPWAEIEPVALLPGAASIAELIAGLDADEVAQIVKLGPLTALLAAPNSALRPSEGASVQLEGESAIPENVLANPTADGRMTR